jgi:methylase of polypeptide subunit release factors
MSALATYRAQAESRFEKLTPEQQQLVGQLTDRIIANNPYIDTDDSNFLLNDGEFEDPSIVI